MRLGIRAQLVLAIGALLLLAFTPLLFAATSLTRATLLQVRVDGARALGRAIAGHVAEARSARGDDQVEPLLRAQLGSGVSAIGLYDREGRLTGSAGETAALPSEVAAESDQVVERGDSVLVVVASPDGGLVAALLDTGEGTLRAEPLLRGLALYSGLLALALLVFLYVVLTRIVVTPLDRIRRAAGRVADGARQLEVLPGGGRELMDLGESLEQMTRALRDEEQALREKVEELERTTSELARAQENIVRSERLASVGRLAAGLAHEIGNPITAILSFQDLLLDGELDDEQREFVERMKKETERVSRILHDLLSFARPPRGREDEDEAERASLGEAIDNVASLVRPQKGFSDVELSIEVEGGLPAVGMNPDRLEQVLLNLLLNAADVVPKPGGRIQVQAEAKDDGLRICIEDNGGGIDPSIRDRLFEPFVSTKEVGRGTGLGLAVCRGLVEANDGRIEAEEGAEGARFVLWLPAADDVG